MSMVDRSSKAGGGGSDVVVSAAWVVVAGSDHDELKRIAEEPMAAEETVQGASPEKVGVS